MAKKQSNPDKRPITTTYYANLEATELVKINRAVHVRSAVLRAVDHMQMNNYGAKLAQVHDERNGKLHRVIVLSAAGKMEILYKSKMTEDI